MLLADAIKRANTVEMGVYSVVVDANEDAAVAFYEHHGFLLLEQNRRTLFLPLSDALKKLFPSTGSK